MSKQYAAQRKEYESRLDMLRKEADAEIESLEMSINGQGGPSSSLDDIHFPTDSNDDINNLSQPVRLSQDDILDGLVDFNEVQRIIFKHLGVRVLKRPREYISPFKISRSRPEISIGKIVYLRKKITSDPELRRYLLSMLQSRLTRSCKPYTSYLVVATIANPKLQTHITPGCKPHSSQL
jgi:hypothetical protein